MVHLNGSERFFNFTNHTSNDPFACSSPITYLRFTALVIFIIISVMGNVFVVAVFYTNKALRTNVNYFIASMAISDVFIPLTYLFPAVSGLFHKDNRWLLEGSFGSVLCKLRLFAWPVSRFVSLFSMMVTAADRFRAILFPFKPALINRKRRPLAITATWILSMVIPAHYLYGARVVSYDTKSYCIYNWNPPSYSADLFRISYYLFFICTTAASGIVLTVLYSKLIIHLYKQNKTLHLATEVIKARAKTNRQITTMLVVVVMAFYAFWSPYAYYNLSWILNPKKGLSCDGRSGFIAHLIYPIINPLIYFIFNESYRRGLRELLCCRCKNNSPPRVLPMNEQNSQPREDGPINNVVEINDNAGVDQP